MQDGAIGFNISQPVLTAVGYSLDDAIKPGLHKQGCDCKACEVVHRKLRDNYGEKIVVMLLQNEGFEVRTDLS